MTRGEVPRHSAHHDRSTSAFSEEDVLSKRRPNIRETAEEVPFADEMFRPPNSKKQRLSLRYFLIPAVIFVVIAANLYASRFLIGSGEGRFPKDNLLDDPPADPDSGSDSEQESAVLPRMGERRTFHMRAPDMVSDPVYSKTSPALRPQTVRPFFAQTGGAIEFSGFPKAWTRLVNQEDASGAKQDAGAVAGGADLTWLAEYSVAVTGTPDDPEAAKTPASAPSTLKIRSCDAIAIARRVDKQVRGEDRHVLRKESEKDRVKRRFGRALSKIASGQMEVALKDIERAERASLTEWDVNSRMLRAQLVLIEAANETLRLRERQEQALTEVKQALKAQDGAGESEKEEANRQLDHARNMYHGLLVAEEDILSAVMVLIDQWAEERSDMLSIVPSVISTEPFKDIMDIASYHGQTFATPKVMMKLASIKSGADNIIGKNRCSSVRGAIQGLLNETRYRLANLSILDSDSSDRELSKLKSDTAREVREARELLIKKKVATWFLDIFS